MFLLFVKVISIGVSVVSLPLLIRNLGPQSFAIFATLQAFYFLTQLLDLGYGQYVLVGKARLFVSVSSRKLSGEFYVFIGSVAFLNFIVIQLAQNGIFGTVIESVLQSGTWEVGLFYIFSVSNIFLLTLSRFRTLTKAYTSQQVFTALAQVIPQIAVLVFTFENSEIMLSILCFQVTQFLVLALNTLFFFRSIQHFSEDLQIKTHSIRKAFKNSSRFFTLQIVSFLVAQGSIILASGMMDTVSLSVYVFAIKIILIYQSILSFVFGPYQTKFSKMREIQFHTFRAFKFKVYYLASFSFFILVSIIICIKFVPNFALVFPINLDLITICFALIYTLILTLNFPHNMLINSRVPPRWYVAFAIIGSTFFLYMSFFVYQKFFLAGTPLLVASCTTIILSLIPNFIYTKKIVTRN